MASIHKRPGSPFWWGAFLLPGRGRRFRSTKCTSRAKALKVVLEWETAARTRATEIQIHRVFSDIHRTIHGVSLSSATVADFAAAWIQRKEGETAKATLAAYKRAIQDFVAHLRDRAHSDLSSITPAEVASMRDKWAKGSAPKTANNKLKALRVFFQSAWRDGVIPENPASKVEAIKEDADKTRRAFTLGELKSVLAAADEQWRGVILAGLYTGQRLADIVRLRWNQVDLVANQIALTTAKTARRQIIPIAKPLGDWLTARAGDDPTAPVFPTLHGRLERGGPSPLSQDFHGILATAGLATPRTITRDKSGPGRRARRPRGELTFHSLRHTATSWLKASGASEAVARDIVGHDSAEVSRHYTHVDEATKRTAIESLPDITS